MLVFYRAFVSFLKLRYLNETTFSTTVLWTEGFFVERAVGLSSRTFSFTRIRDPSIQAWFQKTFLWLYFVIFIRLRWWLYNWSRRSERWSINRRPIGWRFFFAVGGVIVGIIKSSEFFECGIISDGEIFCCCVQSLNLF